MFQNQTMRKQTALIERVGQLRAQLEACPPGDKLLQLSLVVELAFVYEQLQESNK